ncbi:ribonuclease HII [archaeon]|nr:ribonuclease HII [archaeon]
MVLVCGIDEAGRGPVIGPLVMSGVLLEEKDVSKLKKIGVKDSKLLEPSKREELFKEIKKIVKDYKTLIISSKEVDDALESEELNLNKLEAIKSAMIINYLKPDKAILDCPSTNIESYTYYLRTFLKVDVKLKLEHKADLKYVEVGAASILAKVTRDREISNIQSKIKENIGSGYPSDPVTQEFLKKNYKKYDIFRKTWVSYRRLVESKKQKRLNEF